MDDKQELRPDDEITVTVNDFETKYVSRLAYDALSNRVRELEAALEETYEQLGQWELINPNQHLDTIVVQMIDLSIKLHEVISKGKTPPIPPTGDR